MDTPTAIEVRSWAPPAFVWADFGFPVTDPPADPDPLQVRVEWAVGTLYAVTGRTLESIPASGKPEETAIAQKVIAAFVLMEAMGGSAEALEVLNAPWLKSFSAGSYSESRFGPNELGADGKQPPYPPALWALLWALMTEDKQDDWMYRLTGVRRPAGAFFPVDWGGDGSHLHGPVVFGSGVAHPWSW